MSAITPSSDLRLLRVPIELDEKNQIDFNNVQAQTTYFLAIPNYVEEENFTYIRQDGIIRFPACKDDIINYNYVMYRNTAYSDKWFYAFITKMEYINDNMTAISIEEDTFQTWQFDVTYKQSFIEREHVTDDTIGANLIDEGLATGDYIIDDVATSSTNTYAIVLSTTIPMYELLRTGTTTPETIDFPTNTIGDVPSACYLIAFPFTSVTLGTDECSGFNVCLRTLAHYGKTGTITGVYVVPTSMIDFNDEPRPMDKWDNLWSGNDAWLWYDTQQIIGAAWFCYKASFKLSNETITVNKPTTIDGYTPKNKKLLTEKYCYLLVDNNGGSSAKYNYELFSTTNCLFDIKGIPTPGCSVRLIPKDYNSVTTNNLEGLTGAKLPVGSWDNDVYTNWLTQNGVNIAGHKLSATQSGILGGLIQTGVGLGSLALGNPFGIGTMAEGIGNIFGTMKEDYQHSIVPPQAEGNLNSGDVSYADGDIKFTFYKMSIRQQYARSIDGFFDMFGYKVNKFKVINYHTRTYWNYVKTQECNVIGDIPQDSLMNFKKIFNSGVTVWHDPEKFLDYSQSNTIIT